VPNTIAMMKTKKKRKKKLRRKKKCALFWRFQVCIFCKIKI